MPEEPVDVLVVGAGASGAALAWSLADTRMRILCLEQGGWMKPGDYPSNRRNWETAGQEFNPNPNVRQLDADYPVNDSESPISVLNFNGVGGSTILYAAHFPRFHPSDFKVRTMDGVADDWPISYAQLEPYFAENDRMMGVAGLAGDPAYPPKQPPLPPLPLGKLGETIARGFNNLGWHWWPSDSAIITQPYEGRDQCINLSSCVTGCPQGAKSTTDITYWPAALRQGVELRTECRVREITVNSKGMADGVIYYDADGVECRQRAEVVVLACNGVGTPRLLLNSTSTHFPNGLANHSDQVGRNLMFHPNGFVQGTFDESLGSHLGPQGCCIWSHEFYESDSQRDFTRGYSMQITRGPGPVMTALSGVSRGQIPWGPGHHQAFADRFDHTLNVGIMAEDLPESHNRVTLDPDLKDGSGIPAPKVSYRMSENSMRILNHGIEKGRQVMQAAGARDMISHAPLRPTGWHLMGTARMGTDPENSVVNAWGRCHDVRNLFIIDGSIFVTSAAVNPTSTIQALALYVADSIKKNLADLFD
ncbi:MAG: GMC family oxidoreductase [Pseudomonadales bacterium]|jgi:choline dehydrogenase-like flavoprotein|nr:GMC family oxidoreductase [Pseudomonadales bacterium]MDP7594192.1 GMC family oxidoreductase [Pseudomonadales bacterium]HJN52897.1 GMC family oxidoreductase [Pseudomonadales bacterium]|tara:strand:+ start:2673 stop:4274 length:1602 start_codon:yes stop_codon:yes gene_type:complete